MGVGIAVTDDGLGYRTHKCPSFGFFYIIASSGMKEQSFEQRVTEDEQLYKVDRSDHRSKI